MEPNGMEWNGLGGWMDGWMDVRRETENEEKTPTDPPTWTMYYYKSCE